MNFRETLFRWIVFDGGAKDDTVLVRKIWSVYFFFLLFFTYLVDNESLTASRLWLIIGMFLVINVINSVVRYKVEDTRRKEYHYLQYLDALATLVILICTGWTAHIDFLIYLSIVMAILTYGTANGYVFAFLTTLGYGIAAFSFRPTPLTFTEAGYIVFIMVSMLLTAYNGGVLKGQIKEVETANEELAKRNSELYLLQEISNHVSSVLNIDDLLKLIPDIVVGVSGAEFATIYLTEDGTFGGLKSKATNCPNEDLVHELFHGACGYQIRYTFMTGNPSIDNYINCGEFGSIMNMPIKHKDELLGVLIMTHSSSKAFEEANMQLLVPVVSQLAVAIANARLYDRLKQMANIDGLTGVYNRKYFQDYLTDIFSKGEVGQLTLIMIDVDLFKNINDTFGHLMGDYVLKIMTNVIKRAVGSKGILARYGGEEFVVLLPDMDMNEGYELAERLRSQVMNEEIFYQHQRCRVTISLGVAGNNLPCIKSMDDLLNAADGALYEAKNSGRNYTVRADQVLLQKKC